MIAQLDMLLIEKIDNSTSYHASQGLSLLVGQSDFACINAISIFSMHTITRRILLINICLKPTEGNKLLKINTHKNSF